MSIGLILIILLVIFLLGGFSGRFGGYGYGYGHGGIGVIGIILIVSSFCFSWVGFDLTRRMSNAAARDGYRRQRCMSAPESGSSRSMAGGPC
jgi:amino acid transporter